MAPRVAEAVSEETEDFGPAVVAPTAAKLQRTPQRALSTRWWLAIVATAVGVAGCARRGRERRRPAELLRGVGDGAEPGAGVGGDPNSAPISNTWPVLVSSVSVFALTIVLTVCSTVKLFGLSSLITVRVPSPCELNASMVSGLNPAPSTPAPIGSVVMILPSSATKYANNLQPPTAQR